MNADVLPAFADDTWQWRQPTADPVLAFAEPLGKLGRRQQGSWFDYETAGPQGRVPRR